MGYVNELIAFDKGSSEPHELGEFSRLQAIRADQYASQPVDLAWIWAKLTAGEVRVAGAFFTEQRCFVLLDPQTLPIQDARLAPRKLQVLERVLLRGGQKSVAAELGLAPSTIAIIAGSCLRAMGFDAGASRTPLLLTLAAHAYRGSTELRDARMSELSYGGRVYWVVGAARPEGWLADALSPAEYAVSRLLIEGKSHAEIAAIRKTSVRTVANQLAAAFHKLGVSGRSELICRLVRVRTGEIEPEPLSAQGGDAS
jgi:DNA-binding CsgD family transcriptional regulator